MRRHLTSLGFRKGKNGLLELPGSGKDAIRAVHNAHRADWLAANRRFIADRFPKLVRYFASGHDIDVPRITPVAILEGCSSEEISHSSSHGAS